MHEIKFKSVEASLNQHAVIGAYNSGNYRIRVKHEKGYIPSPVAANLL